MTARYVLAPEVALDLIQIWRYIKKQSNLEMVDHVESVIREKYRFSGRESRARDIGTRL